MPAKKTAPAKAKAKAEAEPADASLRAAPAVEQPVKAAKAAKAPARAEKITEAPVEPPAAAEPEPAVADDVPLNRAERRARGKGKGQPQPTARGKVVGSHGPTHTQRMWANRRSGG
jgi:hypothetical protein